MSERTGDGVQILLYPDLAMADPVSLSRPDDFAAMRVVEEALAERAGALAEREFSLRWMETHAPVRHFLLGFLSDRSVVDDCLQEVALIAWKKGPRDGSPEQFLAFSLECAKRLAMAEVRKKYRTKKKLLSLETHAALATRAMEFELRDAHSPRDRVSALRSCMASLEPPARRLLELRYASQGDPSVLKGEARKTGSSMDAIYKKLERLRALLKVCVTSKLKGPGNDAE
ncbi:hypothetical protein OKA04_04090 [Luteolibacter flavescens]|uniref:Sigma-70 family RNA polymerase sigma factor n=1 Tax=Luteolibacter flavescens TaxID=1859460 RepID=A0ABT3FL31_9BACT|nr:sigma factor [Luteolibacter flavescens]MCW1883894.1 hypothetical protein [Luteolibacter flavescens]